MGGELARAICLLAAFRAAGKLKDGKLPTGAGGPMRSADWLGTFEIR
jgi:hypothetical protein